MKKIKIPDKVRSQIQGLLAQNALAESALQMYIQGYLDAQEQKGSWNLNTGEWVLEQTSTKGAKE